MSMSGLKPSAALQARREEFARYKRDVQKRGKPFFPYAMFHDTVMSLVVVVVIVGLACIWKWTTPGDHTGTGAGWLGTLYSDKADPGTTSFVPRPDWYFYFLFYLLRIFKWPNSVILGTVGIPTIIMVLMLALPFLDRRRERRLSRRPVAVVITILTVIAMGTLTYKGATAKEALGSELAALPPVWAKKQGFEDNPRALAGAKLFAQAGCQQCHTYLGTGSSNLGAPDLSDEGTRGRGVQGLTDYISDPSKFGNNVMPQFGAAVHPGADRVDRHVPGRLARREVATGSGTDTLPHVRVFLGVTGASGAPYAARLLEALTEADCEVGVCISGAGLEVIATELYGDARLSRDETIARFTEHARGEVTVFDPQDWRSPYASGSAKVDAYVICPARWARSGRSPPARCRT